jgi:dipeptidyl aminopeptidase/acylaminoacyl peptidase
MPNRKGIKNIKRTFLILFVVGLLLTHFFIPRLIAEIRNPVVGLIKRNPNVSHKLTGNENSETKRKIISINSFDGIKLSASITYSKLDSVKGTIILLHGIRSNKSQFLDLSNFLSENGYNTVAMDLRAHGESEGQFCSFGVNEKKDVQKLIDHLSQNENMTHIGIWGQSLGGAISLQALGFDERLKFGIVESAFTDFHTIVNDYFDLHAGFSFAPFSNYLVNRTGSIAEFDPYDASPIKYCERIVQPILIVHGNEDERIHIKYGRENFSKIQSEDKEFIEIDNANHNNVWKVGGKEYFDKILLFLNRQTVGNNAYNVYGSKG